MTQELAYERFRDLHEARSMFIMPNAWDGASAAMLQRAGFAALGTSSAAIAWGMGRQDGTRSVTLEEAVANGGLLAEVTGLPVNGDLEDGFGPTPDDCVCTVEAAIAGGLAGLGIEDTTADPERPIHAFDDAVARVRAAAGAARGRILLTGRTDLLLHGRGDIEEVIGRLTAFAEVGADVLYAPGLADMADVERVVRAVAPRPVNVLASSMLPLDGLRRAGVRRLSLGATLYRAAMLGLEEAATALLADDVANATRGVPRPAILAMLPRP